jgi:hypothetical protein
VALMLQGGRDMGGAMGIESARLAAYRWHMCANTHSQSGLERALFMKPTNTGNAPNWPTDLQVQRGLARQPDTCRALALGAGAACTCPCIWPCLTAATATAGTAGCLSLFFSHEVPPHPAQQLLRHATALPLLPLCLLLLGGHTHRTRQHEAKGACRRLAAAHAGVAA